MKFNLFKLGKPKNQKKTPKSNAAATQIAELEEQLNGWTDNLKQTEQRLKKLSGKVSDITELEATPIQPHGPIRELVIEPEGDSEDDPLEEELEVVKMVEVQPEITPAPPTENAEKSDYARDSFKELFIDEDDEENPLANLIHSLPDVTIDELEEDLKEIKDIIKDWQKK
jgi:septal ring factor EnvC (AmiA/AmiB activator)